MWPSLPMVALSTTAPLAPVCLAILGYSGSLRVISTACWMWPRWLALPAVVVGVVTGGAAGVGAGALGRATGGGTGAPGTTLLTGRFTPGTEAVTALAVGASGMSLGSAGRMRLASGATDD